MLIEQAVFEVPGFENLMKNTLNKSSTTNSLIQAITLNKDPTLQVTIALLIPENISIDQNSIHFVRE